MNIKQKYTYVKERRTLLPTIAYVRTLEEALRRLVLAARTSGGVAGRDDYLCGACDAAEALLRETKRNDDAAGYQRTDDSARRVTEQRS